MKILTLIFILKYDNFDKDSEWTDVYSSFSEKLLYVEVISSMFQLFKFLMSQQFETHSIECVINELDTSQVV